MPATADKRKGDGFHRLYYCELICFYFLLLTFAFSLSQLRFILKPYEKENSRDCKQDKRNRREDRRDALNAADKTKGDGIHRLYYYEHFLLLTFAFSLS
jgi:hypothetical protein